MLNMQNKYYEDKDSCWQTEGPVCGSTLGNCKAEDISHKEERILKQIDKVVQDIEAFENMDDYYFDSRERETVLLALLGAMSKKRVQLINEFNNLFS